MIEKIISKKLFLEAFRFGITGLVLLSIKLLLMSLLKNWMTPLIAYAIIHVLIFFMSYLLHSKFTFKKALAWGKLGAFFKAVILIKAFDYVLFSILFVRFDINSNASILTATLVVLIFRYLSLKITFKNNPNDA